MKAGKTEPFVVGGVVDPGFCLDLINSNGIHAVEEAYASFRSVVAASGAQMPQNIGGDDLLLSQARLCGNQFFSMLPGKRPASSPSIPSAAYSLKECASTPIQDFVKKPTFKYASEILSIFTVSSACKNAISHTRCPHERLRDERSVKKSPIDIAGTPDRD